ncbi:MAG TPA: FmdE family protein [Desulfomonilaceae bacterium]|nr:FmdE family protein [Desulfomonilaceae bacterium]
MKKKSLIRSTGWMNSTLVALAILVVCVVMVSPARAVEQSSSTADIRMGNLQEVFEVGLKFHGHKCPAMPLGLRAGIAAMNALGVERSKDKELFVISETGKGHAAGCFLDGIMTATGCTYGKSNIDKRHWSKMAFTLVDQQTGKAVRVSLKPDFFENALKSPFVQERKAGVPPQDIKPEITDPMVARILSGSESSFLEIGEVHSVPVEKSKSVFTAKRCAVCGDLTFVNKLRVADDGALVCVPCSGYKD